MIEDVYTTEEKGGKDGDLWCGMLDLHVFVLRIGKVLKEGNTLSNVHKCNCRVFGL